MRAARGARRARRARPQHGRAVQGEPRPARPLQGRPALGLARASATCCPPARGLPLAAIRFRWQGGLRRTPPLGDDPGGAAAARPPRRRSTATSAAGPPSHADERTAADALRGRRRLHLPPRPRRAVRRVRLGAHGAGPAQPAAHGALPDRRLERAGRRAARRARARLGVADRDRPPRRPRCPSRPTIVATELSQARELLGDDSLRLAQRPHRLPRPRRSSTAAATPSSSPTSTRPAGSSATARPTRRSRPTARSWCRRRCRCARARAPTRRRCGWSACSTPRCPDWRERETWRRRQVMDGRTGAARPSRHDLARPAGGRPRRRRLPRRRHGGRARAALRGRLGERGRGGPPRRRLGRAAGRRAQARGLSASHAPLWCGQCRMRVSASVFDGGRDQRRDPPLPPCRGGGRGAARPPGRARSGRRRTSGAWSIPKGEVDEGEEPRACALRELREELGSPPALEPEELIELGSVRQKAEDRRRLGGRGRFRPGDAGEQHLRDGVAAALGRRARVPRGRPGRVVRPRGGAAQILPAQSS